MPAYYSVQSQFDRFFAGIGQSKNKIRWNNKPLIQCFVGYFNRADILIVARIFPHP